MSILFTRETYKKKKNEKYRENIHNFIILDGGTLFCTTNHGVKTPINSLSNDKIIDGHKFSCAAPVAQGRTMSSNLYNEMWFIFFQQNMTPETEEPLLLLTAPTRSPAFNTGGTTLHSHSAFMVWFWEKWHQLGKEMHYAIKTPKCGLMCNWWGEHG